MTESVVVLGLGNVLMGDDGLGPAAIAHLEATFEFPPGVSVLDAGTPGLDLHPHVDGCDALIIIDTVKTNDPPGTVRTWDREAIVRQAATPRVAPHDPGLGETLLTLEFAASGPRDVILVGVAPAVVATGPGLSPAVRAALPEVVATTVAALERLGHTARPRPDPPQPDLWWERP